MSGPLQERGGSERERPFLWELVLLRPSSENKELLIKPLRENTNISGETTVAVRFLDENPPEDAWLYQRFQLFIDGKDGGKSTMITQTKVKKWMPGFGIDTNWYPNGGPHEWKVRDTITGKEQVRRVYYQNVLHSIKIGIGLSLRPEPDGFPKRCPISAKLTEKRRWTVSIMDDLEEKQLRKYTGYSKEINVKWDGRDDAGREVLPPQEDFGQYWVVIASDTLPDGGTRKQMVNVYR